MYIWVCVCIIYIYISSMFMHLPSQLSPSSLVAQVAVFPVATAL